MVSRGLVVIYWIALPLLMLAFFGYGLVIAFADRPPTLATALSALGSGGLAALIIWRLMLHRRALAASQRLSKSELELFSDAPESEKTE